MGGGSRCSMLHSRRAGIDDRRRVSKNRRRNLYILSTYKFHGKGGYVRVKVGTPDIAPIRES